MDPMRCRKATICSMSVSALSATVFFAAWRFAEGFFARALPAGPAIVVDIPIHERGAPRSARLECVTL